MDLDRESPTATSDEHRDRGQYRIFAAAVIGYLVLVFLTEVFLAFTPRGYAGDLGTGEWALRLTVMLLPPGVLGGMVAVPAVRRWGGSSLRAAAVGCLAGVLLLAVLVLLGNLARS